MKGRVSRVKMDACFLDRRKVLQCLDEVRSTPQLSLADADVLSQKLVRLGRVVPAALIQALETERDSAVMGLAARTLERIAETEALNRPGYIERIKRLVLRPDIPDDTRMRLLVILTTLGVDVSESRYAEAFRDLSAVAEASREDMLTEVAGDEFILGQFLEEIGRQPPEVRVAMVEDYSHSSHPVVVTLYRILGRWDDPMMGHAVVDRLEAMKNSTAVGVLQDVAATALSEETRERAARAAKAMRFRGIDLPTAAPPKLAPIYSSLVTSLDGAGNRMIWVARGTRRSAGLAVIHLMVSEERGIKDCFGSTGLLRSEYDESVATLRESGDVAFEEFSYDYIVDLLRDALWINQHNQTPVAAQFMLLMDIFADRPLHPQPYVPPLEFLDPLDLGKDLALVEESVHALALPALSTWIVESPAVFRTAERVNRLLASSRGTAAFRRDVDEQLEKLDRQIVRTELAPVAAALRRRMELTADYLLRSAPRERETARALVAAAQHLPPCTPDRRELAWPVDALAPEEHPFLLAIARRSLINAEAALRMGQA